jgi:NAD(P)-dependent dehydrogenase (short-subunit alcohol dehydrogenase family)
VRLPSFRGHFEVNVFAPYRLMQLVAPGMIERRRGWIINISSDASKRPGEGPYGEHRPLHFAYGVTKSALEHLTQCAAYDLAEYGIAVNALLPSMAIPTPGLMYFMESLAVSDTAEAFAEAAVRLALVSPNEVTGWIAYHRDILEPELGRRGRLAR